MDPLVARKTWRTAEPLHGMIYFVGEADERYAKLGIDDTRMGYFASRAAAMGPVPAEVVIATFYNFNPGLVHAAIPQAWNRTSPADLMQARLDAAGAALRRGLGALADSPAVHEASVLAYRAAESARDDLAGRPLFAGHAAQEWPDDPLLVLWWAQTLLREYRGDGHVAALLNAGLGPVEALVMHAASGEVSEAVLRATRAWPEDEWLVAVERLHERGLVRPDGSPTDEGLALRQHVEDATDRAALRPYEALGEEGCRRLRELTRPLSRAVVEAGLLTPDLSRYGR